MVNAAVSPVVRTWRWIALGAGVVYGQRRYAELVPIRAAERQREIELCDAFLDAKIEAGRIAMEEYAKDSYLFGTAKE